MLESWAKKNTLIYCERHGWVSGKFGKIPPTGREVPTGYAKLCKGKGYFIEYCCGLKCTDEEPESIYDGFRSSASLTLPGVGEGPTQDPERSGEVSPKPIPNSDEEAKEGK